MALTSSVYHFRVDLSDVDRGVYTELKLPVALHPSESLEFMATRIIAYLLEYAPGISFSPGIGSPDEPAISLRGLDGTLLLWVDIGSPNADRIHRAAKAAKRVAIYCHRNAELTLENLQARDIYNAQAVSLFSFQDSFVADFASALEKRNELSISRTEQSLYIVINGSALTSTLTEHSL
jgi:uncharacterized protein YaeQ